MSFIIKRDSEVIDYEDAFGKMNTVDGTDLNIYSDIWQHTHVHARKLGKISDVDGEGDGNVPGRVLP